MNGVLLLNKPYGITSHDAVNKIRRIYSTKKVGHTGTLDPMATGVLPILVGNAVKASEFLVSDNKEYRARLILGIETDTEDTSGKVIKESSLIPDDKSVEEAINSFLGDYEQIPPMYSAIKVNGEKLYDLARRGVVIEREARKVRVDAISSKKISEREWEITCAVSKGTYIRTLVADIGKKLGCGAAMSALERTVSGKFTLSDSYTFEEIENSSDLSALLLKTETLFEEYPRAELSEFYTRLFENGAEIYLARAGLKGFDEGNFIRVCDSNGKFFAFGEVKNFEKGLAIKSKKFFKETL